MPADEPHAARDIARVIEAAFIMRSLERIGDHARNIARHVGFIGGQFDPTATGVLPASLSVKNWSVGTSRRSLDWDGAGWQAPVRPACGYAAEWSHSIEPKWSYPPADASRTLLRHRLRRSRHKERDMIRSRGIWQLLVAMTALCVATLCTAQTGLATPLDASSGSSGNRWVTTWSAAEQQPGPMTIDAIFGGDKSRSFEN